MVLVSTTLAVLAYVVLAVAVVVGVIALAAIAEFVVTNRKQRLATHDSIRHYYGSFVLAR
jgi:hypothetical protein